MEGLEVRAPPIEALADDGGTSRVSSQLLLRDRL